MYIIGYSFQGKQVCGIRSEQFGVFQPAGEDLCWKWNPWFFSVYISNVFDLTKSKSLPVFDKTQHRKQCIHKGNTSSKDNVNCKGQWILVTQNLNTIKNQFWSQRLCLFFCYENEIESITFENIGRGDKTFLLFYFIIDETLF